MLLNIIVVTMISLFFISFCAVESVDENREVILADGFALTFMFGFDALFALVVPGNLLYGQLDASCIIMMLMGMTTIVVFVHYLLLLLLEDIVNGTI